MLTADRSQYLLATDVETIHPLSSKLVSVAAPSTDFDVDNVAGTPLLVGHGVVPCDLHNPCVMVVNTSTVDFVVRPGDIVAQRGYESAETTEICCSALMLQHTEQAGGLDVFLKDKELQKRLTRQQRKQLFSMLQKYKSLFDPAPTNHATTAASHVIDTESSRPISAAPYQTTPERREFISQEVVKLVNSGQISPSTSPWASPVVLVMKKDGSVRFCIDYRRLNAVTKRDCYPLPRIDDALHALQGMTWFTSLDLAQGYWQVPMDANSKEKTAFVSHAGLYEFNVMPFGLTNAPATFQRMMDLVLAGVKWKSCLVYLDDIIVFSKDFDSHVKDVEEVLQRLQKSKLYIKPQKCMLCSSSVNYLGHIVSGSGIRLDPIKVRALKDMPPPDTLKKLQSFLGFSNYYKRFVSNYASVASPLYRLLCVGTPWKWGKVEEQAFQTLKDLISEQTMLHQPDGTLPFILDTDGSKDGLGVVLSQVRDGIEEPIAFDSRALSKLERKWHCCEFEALAAVWGVRQFAHFLTDREFTIRVDHHNLRWLKTAKKSRLQRWALELLPFHYDTAYRRGVEHCNCDGLSRNPVARTDGESRQCEICSLTNITTSESPEVESALMVQSSEVPSVDFDELRRMQLADPSLKTIIDKLRAPLVVNSDGVDGREPSFCYENDTLFFIDKESAWEPVLRLCVPDGPIRTVVMRQYHSSEVTGHLGFTKTYGRLRERFHWVGMKEDVLDFVKSCKQCQLRKTRYRPQGLLQPIRVNEPWELVGMDIFGELPCTENGNRWCLVFIDHFTKYPEIIPLRKIDSTTIADCIHNYLICRHGCPSRLLSDRGPQFLASPVKRLCKRYGINKLFTTPYHPQGDPQAESFMKILGHCLAILAKDRKADWDRFCESVAFAYRTAIHPTTRYSPFFLNHLREARLPADRNLMQSIGFGTPGIVSADSEDLRWNIMCNVRSQVTNLLRQSQSTSKHRYDVGRRPHTYAPGDYVLLRRPGLVGKLADKWQGPFCVKEIRNNGLTITIEHPKSGQSQVVHTDRLAPFHTSTTTDSRPTTVSTVPEGLRADPDPESNCQLLDSPCFSEHRAYPISKNNHVTPSAPLSNPEAVEVPITPSSIISPLPFATVSSVITNSEPERSCPLSIVPSVPVAEIPISNSEISPQPTIAVEATSTPVPDTPVIPLVSDIGAEAEGSDEADEESDELEVDKILGYDQRSDGDWYKVRWRGYGPRDDTWEPTDNLSNATDAVTSFKVKWNQTHPNNPFIL
jgi:transposase InsO family protein